MNRLASTLASTLAVTGATALAALTLTGCGADATPTFTKDAADETPVVVTLSATDIDDVPLADGTVRVLGDDASAMEVFEWFFEQNDVAFTHDGGLIKVVGDLAGDQTQGWMIYVNDEKAQVGAASLIPNDGDVIELRFVDYASLS